MLFGICFAIKKKYIFSIDNDVALCYFDATYGTGQRNTNQRTSNGKRKTKPYSFGKTKGM